MNHCTGSWNFGIEWTLSGNHLMDCFFVCLFVCLKGIERLGSGNYRVDGWLVLAGSSPGNWARIRSRLRTAQIWHQFLGNFDDVRPFPLPCVWICLKQQVGLWGINWKPNFVWKSYSGRQKCHAKALRHDFWRWCLVFRQCVLRSKCNSPTFMRVKSLKGFKMEKDSPKKLLYAPLILHREAPSMAQDYLLLSVFHLSPNICPKFCFWHQTLIHSSDLGPIYLWLTTWLMLFWYDSD